MTKNILSNYNKKLIKKTKNFGGIAMDIGKIPPHDVEAEQAVIGSMLTDKEAVASSIEVLKEEDFYREDNRIIYSAMLNLYNRAEPIDLITLKAELESMGKI